MIREDRSEFWSRIAEHPDVKPHVTLGQAFDFNTLVQHPDVTPLRSDNGGYLFHRLDGLGRLYDLHALYHPSGWGKEASAALKSALAWMFDRGAEGITALEVAGNWRSRPPRSFGFRPDGEPQTTLGHVMRPWILTRDAWEQSPARRRM